VGDESIALLDSGVKIEMEATREILFEMVRTRFGAAGGDSKARQTL
jgi:hypothetical protein